MAPRSFDTISKGNDTTEKAHTLQQFAAEYFRESQMAGTVRQKTLIHSAGRKASNEELWKHSRDPIRLPLLKSLLHKDELSQEACMIFTAILKYMGDLPSRALRTSNELTDQIFEGPLKHVIIWIDPLQSLYVLFYRKSYVTKCTVRL